MLFWDIMGKPQRHCLHTRLLREFNFQYITSYTANVFPSVNLCINSFLCKLKKKKKKRKNIFAVFLKNWLFWCDAQKCTEKPDNGNPAIILSTCSFSYQVLLWIQINLKSTSVRSIPLSEYEALQRYLQFRLHFHMLISTGAGKRWDPLKRDYLTDQVNVNGTELTSHSCVLNFLSGRDWG